MILLQLENSFIRKKEKEKEAMTERPHCFAVKTKEKRERKAGYRSDP